MQTFAQFKVKLRKTLWPAGEAKNLRYPDDRWIALAMMELQKWVPCVQQFNTSQFKHCATFWEDAKTVVDMPHGYIRDVYTIANDDWRDEVHLESASWNEIQSWATKLYRAKTPMNVGLPKLPMGYRNAEKAVDSICGRARLGIWAYNRHRLFVAPWIQSNETLIVEWDGLKSEWVDTDGVNELYWTVDYEDAITLFVRWKHEFFYGDMKAAMAYEQAWNNVLAQLMWNCREMTAQQAKKNIYDSQYLRSSQLADDKIPDAPAARPLAALIGDWGSDGNPLADNVAQIEGMNPQIVIPLGDNIYGAYPIPTVDSLWGKYWSTRIFPYTGAYTAGTEQTIWPAWGNHDWDYNLQKELDFMTLKNNERYYSVVKGPVEFFIVSSDPRDPDLGYVNSATSTENSTMGQWLKVKLALSTAKWKVVVWHHPPYCSDINNTPGCAWMRWPLETWGANLLLNGHGHNYEDGLIGNLPWIVNGLGGKDIRAFGASTPSSQYLYNQNYGFGILTADCDALTHKFYTRTGVLIRTVSIAAKTGAVSYTIDDNGTGGTGDDTMTEFVSRFINVTGFVGGGTNLDAIATVSLGIGTIAEFYVDGSLATMRLTSGIGATSVPSIVRPIDFNSVTNPRVWISLDDYLTDEDLKEIVSDGGPEMISALYDSGAVVTTGVVRWRDGSAGVYTTLVKNTTFNAVDSFSVTNTNLGKTVTQPTITRDASGSVTSKPALVVT